MRPTITMEIRRETYEELLTLADTLGYPPEAAMSYAVRLVNACIREGLLTDIPTLRDETEPKAVNESGGKVIATGGLAVLVAEESNAIDVLDGLLTLKGLRLIYEKNRPEA